MVTDCFEQVSLMGVLRYVLFAGLACCVAGCPDSADSGNGGGDGASLARATHSGLISIQDVSLANLPAAGHGLTVNVFFNAARAPDYEEQPGTATGCKAWSYDRAKEPIAPLEDHGKLRIEGVEGGPFECRFDSAARGYVCPTATGTGTVHVVPDGSTAKYTIPGAAFSPADVGRYLDVRGAASASNANAGAFAIVQVMGPTEVVVANARASEESFSGVYTVLAGAGPTPNDRAHPFGTPSAISIRLTPGGGAAFAFPDTTIVPGEAFTLTDASAARLSSIPVNGDAVTLGCASCGKADGTIVRLTTTDADVTGLSPAAMPPPQNRSVEISCATVGGETITIPAAAMDLVKKAHAASPITRIRTAFMRDGVAVRTNAPPAVPNRAVLVAGRGILGFTRP